MIRCRRDDRCTRPAVDDGLCRVHAAGRRRRETADAARLQRFAEREDAWRRVEKLAERLGYGHGTSAGTVELTEAEAADLIERLAR